MFLPPMFLPSLRSLRFLLFKIPFFFLQKRHREHQESPLSSRRYFSYLCVLCASVVKFVIPAFYHRGTEGTERQGEGRRVQRRLATWKTRTAQKTGRVLAPAVCDER